jgi:hypothetical protein
MGTVDDLTFIAAIVLFLLYRRERAQDDCDVRKWQILLQKDFCASGEQHSLKVRRACATLIQKSIRPDSIVARFYSTASAR